MRLKHSITKPPLLHTHWYCRLQKRIRENLRDASAGNDIEALEKAMEVFANNHLEDGGDYTEAEQRMEFLLLRKGASHITSGISSRATITQNISWNQGVGCQTPAQQETHSTNQDATNSAFIQFFLFRKRLLQQSLTHRLGTAI